MATLRRPGRVFSSESSGGASSSDDDAPSTIVGKSATNKAGELSLKDDEDTIEYQAPLPDYYEEAGESDDDRRLLPRANQSSASGTIDDEHNNRKQLSTKKKRKKTYYICVSMCKYECVRRAAKRLNFREVADEEDWNVYWTDTSVGIERVAQMKKWQKINHFPGMSEICRKDSLTRNMCRMMKMFPKEYSFYPKAWCLPADYSDFAKYFTEKKYKTYISKPDVGCQGRGIFITKNPTKDIKPTDNFVVQVYVNRPFLLDGFKFDLRVYVAVTSCDPFRIFVYKDGLARFTTQQYEEPSNSNCKDIFMHLTNYAIQKRSDDFIRDEDSGTKRRITTINRWLVEHGYDTAKLWMDIDDVVIKVLISAHSVLKHNYRACFPNHYRGSACFEILGFDILIDRKLKPYVLEVNHSPSFTTDSKLDREIKDALIYDTLLLLNMPAADKRRFIEEEKRRAKERLFQKINKKDNKYREEQEDLAQQWQKEIEKWEEQHMGNYRRIYPGPDSAQKYDRFYTQSGTLYSETAASKARLEQAKAQIDELQRKQDKLNAIKNRKSLSGTVNQNSREVPGESPTRRPLPSVKPSRSSSFNRTPLKRLTANANLTISPAQAYGESMKTLDIDENEEFERMTLLKQRETLIRGMGVIDMCHRLLFGTPGTMANVPMNTNMNAPANVQQHIAVPIDIADSSQNLSLLQYAASKLPHGQSNRYPSNNGVSTQVFQQYFSNQQQQMHSKLETRSTRNGTTLSQNSSRNGRYQQALRLAENNLQYNNTTSNSNNINRILLPTNPMPQLSTNLLSKTSMTAANSTIDSSIRTKSANTMPRTRTGGLYLVSCGTNITRLPINANSNGGNVASTTKEIAVNGSSISAGNKLESLCDMASLEQFKRLHLTKLSSNDTVLSSTSSPTPK
ncbi:unnamed protein product [Rotaria magnacalcarata]|uniref:Tubulin polyglutamylase ttll6 n=3 Tax=Rotaria magnacalcarata TaxID=392030 RepID=A0A815M1E2_9BILA|nr:unnamed protein product [Rotaria magnacalcarata]